MKLKELIPEELIVGGDSQEDFANLSIDSRHTKRGDLFFAIRGTRENAHEFIRDALAKGALACVVDSSFCSSEGLPIIVVKDTRKALALAACNFFHQPSRQMSIIGITGTNGKTSVASFTQQLWALSGINAGLIGTLGISGPNYFAENQLTTPGSLDLQRHLHEMLARGIRNVAIEVSSIALDQFRTWGTRFKSVVFTNFTQDHLDYHGTMEAYLACKQKLFDHEFDHCVLNIDDPFVKQIGRSLPKHKTVTVSIQNTEADFFAREIRRQNSTRTIEIVHRGNKSVAELNLIGDHNLTNILCSLAAIHPDGIDPLLNSKLFKVTSPAGRLQRVPSTSPQPAVYVDYAHSPDSLKNALQILKSWAEPHGGRVICVFGCGGERDRSKRGPMGEVATSLSDLAIVTSDNPRSEDPNAIIDEIVAGVSQHTELVREPDRRLAIQLAVSRAGPGDYVLIAGKGHEQYQIIGSERRPFDDVAEAANALNNTFSKR